MVLCLLPLSNFHKNLHVKRIHFPKLEPSKFILGPTKLSFALSACAQTNALVIFLFQTCKKCYIAKQMSIL